MLRLWAATNQTTAYFVELNKSIQTLCNFLLWNLTKGILPLCFSFASLFLCCFYYFAYKQIWLVFILNLFINFILYIDTCKFMLNLIVGSCDVLHIPNPFTVLTNFSNFQMQCVRMVVKYIKIYCLLLLCIY